MHSRSRFRPRHSFSHRVDGRERGDLRAGLQERYQRSQPVRVVAHVSRPGAPGGPGHGGGREGSAPGGRRRPASGRVLPRLVRMVRQRLGQTCTTALSTNPRTTSGTSTEGSFDEGEHLRSSKPASIVFARTLGPGSASNMGGRPSGDVRRGRDTEEHAFVRADTAEVTAWARRSSPTRWTRAPDGLIALEVRGPHRARENPGGFGVDLPTEGRHSRPEQLARLVARRFARSSSPAQEKRVTTSTS